MKAANTNRYVIKRSTLTDAIDYIERFGEKMEAFTQKHKNFEWSKELSGSKGNYTVNINITEYE